MKSRFNQFGKSSLAALLVGMILLLDAMAVSPALHELIHKDADKATHQCAVTLFAHGQVDSPTVEVSACVPPVSIETISQIIFSAFAPAIENLPSGRAPPVSASSQA